MRGIRFGTNDALQNAETMSANFAKQKRYCRKIPTLKNLAIQFSSQSYLWMESWEFTKDVKTRENPNWHVLAHQTLATRNEKDERDSPNEKAEDC